jgi:hypothetical protein
MVACEPPAGHYTKVGGDCDDEKDDVHPQVTAQEKKYFEGPYTTQSGTDSFDYDCSGAEEGDPGETKGATMCPGLLSGKCTGNGYLPIATGNRVKPNGYCGSTTFRTCVSMLLTCTPQDITNFPSAYRCK